MVDNPNLWILNGPNLNLLGDREPDQYGHETLDMIKDRCVREANKHNLSIVFKQTNHEEYENGKNVKSKEDQKKHFN